jgi:RNA polymerase sigma factor (sigma-70 family)
MDESIYNLINCIQKGDEDALLEMINRFEPLIKKLSKKMIYEKSETDLIIFFIQILQSLDLGKFSKFSEASLVRYIQVSLNNKAIGCSKRHYLYKIEEVHLDFDMFYADTNTGVDISTKLAIHELLELNELSQRQREVLKRYYLYGYSDIEIAQKLNISRQAVCKSRNRGLNIIRDYLKIDLLN